MLKALELCGFKSFADKTRFEFPPGITVVVGPNGSGKSNIVDAIKWVLGEQSAKSLRGREMADVIFKGSGGQSALRKPANTAEVTIVFANTDGLLAVDTDEVRVTRRVYRSGEGEYLINAAPCRLRDVKDLFRGTGMGTDAYSLIEQGKVDTLLQATPRDRRAIFEEAAGISRFKAKKVETQRRLERVEQNLERLCDIVDEVESQLRSVRNQASKARRYKEYSDRLKSLRTHVGLADWRRLTADLQEAERRLDEVQQEAQTREQAVAQLEAQLAAADQHVAALDGQLHDTKSAAAEVQQALARHQATINHQHDRLDELNHEIQRGRRQWRSMTSRAGDLGVELRQLQSRVSDAERADSAIRQRLHRSQDELAATEGALAEYQTQRDDQHQEHAHQQRVSGDLERRIEMFDSELHHGSNQFTQLYQRYADIDGQRTQAVAEHERLERERQRETREQTARDQLSAARDGLHAQEQRLNELQQQAVDLQRQLAVAGERANVLQELERRNEGLSPGVQDLLRQAEDTPLGALATVRGMVADLIRVDVRMAPLIDAALGERTQFVVVDGAELIHQIAEGRLPLAGRVGLIDLRGDADPHPPQPALETDSAVLGRADSFVEVDPPFAALVARWLGQTWCVETLRDALKLQEQVSHPLRFVTRRGEILDAEHGLLAGPRQAAMGLVSRRSELRTLRWEINELEPSLRETENAVAQAKHQIAHSEHEVDSFTTAYDQAASELMNARLATRTLADRIVSLDQQRDQVAADLETLINRNEQAVAQRLRHGRRLHDVAALVQTAETRLIELDQQIARLEEERQSQLGAVTEVKVELAKSEQNLDSLNGQLIRFQADQQERERAVSEVQAQLQQACLRHQQAERAILQATTAVAELYLRQEQLDHRIHRALADRRQQLAERQSYHDGWEQQRRRRQEAEQQRHQLELHVNQSRLERESLEMRVRDDYQIELAEVGDLPVDNEAERRQREEIDKEINELRRRLSNIGAVNMAALDEIESLEQRHESLAAQYQDLVDAKESLARIIHKINADSRRLFTESLERIRENFQTLFRRVFGGGQADIVLEEGVDILDAGIDIVATPPGKHSLGISLLSGGERALTAVTLLLAIFQYRPSPFCVLDEVDGPLDEANIGRFVDVLHEFLKWTKFVVVTHSKKTMTAANTLYGVTMQESGVSKRVSVQFEDVSEDGHIRAEAIQRSHSDEPSHDSPPDGDGERGAA